MERMIRKQVYLERGQDQILKQRARERGVTEAQIIRDALSGPGYTVARRARVDRDPAAAEKALAFMRSLATRPGKARAAGRSWTRESLYEDRLRRWPKS